jgi:hypothetical protein
MWLETCVENTLSLGSWEGKLLSSRGWLVLINLVTATQVYTCMMSLRFRKGCYKGVTVLGPFFLAMWPREKESVFISGGLYAGQKNMMA